jgi:CheY-like chemotaxis protein/PAS domain-containing protein
VTPPAAAEYRDKILYALAVIAALGVTPFSVANLLKGYYLIGALSLLVVAVLAIDAYAIYRGRRPPLPLAIAFGLILVGIVAAIWQRGVMSVFWAFPAILLFHFVLERRIANAFNVALAAVVGIAAWPALEADFALRIVVALLLTIAFANVFSYAVEAEQRREREQQRRLDLLARATQAGFFEWERHHNVARYSERLKEMLGYASDADTSAWPPFHQFIHPDDREQRVRLFQEGARSRGAPGEVLRHVPGQNRLLHRGGETLLVRTEGLFIYGADGRVSRYIAAMYDVSELHRKAEELSRAIHVREEVERIARHDLKTPLNSIVSVPPMLRERRRLEPYEEELLGMVEGAAYRILDMVNLSIDLYRMEQGEYRFSPRAVDLPALVDTVWREIRAHADTKRLRLDKRARGRGLAWGEPLLCYSILANVLKNAAEAAPEGSAITVELTETGETLALSVHNPGAVPESVRAKFFQKYASAGKAGGHGLGAYSARLMSRVQRGELEMQTAEASGTTLTLTLPLAQAAAMPAADAQRSREARAALPALRVLVVDDDEFNVLFMRANLPAPPLVVDTAINGRAALDAARARAPDVVFMDLEMPVLDGFEALAGLRRLEAAAGRRPAVVIAFSSYDDEATRRRCLEAGFDGYLTKPAPRERIHELIARAAGMPAAQAVVLDPELAAHLPAFVASRKALVDELARALAGGERAAARRLSHKLAGSLSLYGFHWAAGAARAIHREAESGELAALAAACAELRHHLEHHGQEEKAAAGR